jgi:hypothetical protein
MRRAALALVAAVLVAACQVRTDGAHCDASASDRTLSCPSGQACGNDGTCSARAATCAATRCTPGATRCGTQGAVESCSAKADPTCGAWIAEACEAGLACGTRSGAPACECLPPDGAVLVVDPAGSTTPSTLPYATGRADAPGCRFARLGDALAAAASAKQPMTVSARIGPFGDATGEAFPLDVAPGVSLEGDGSGGVSIATAAPVASSMIVLHAGATLRGVNLVNRVGSASASGAAPTAAVALACDPTPTPPPTATLEGVTVDTDALTRGVAVTCPASLTDVSVSGAQGPALYVNPPDAAFETIVTGGRFGESATGVEVHGGVVRLAGPEGASPDAFLGFAAPTLDITANDQHGVAVGSGTVTTLALERVRIAGNGGTGLRVDNLASGSSLSIVRCEISGNRASVDASQYASPVRKAGGIILSQANGPPALDFRGNLVACNGADQIGFFVVGNVNLAPSACGTDSNVVRTAVTGQVAVFASDYANVSASNNYWIPVPPPYSAKQFTWAQPCALPDNAPSPCP